ncbi:MAG: multicopper oxidase domain-containing protein [Phycisphaerae bacterium]|nr:multicopper oxidase domain-containing protein [Phycisphaerae bacterium]
MTTRLSKPPARRGYAVPSTPLSRALRLVGCMFVACAAARSSADTIVLPGLADNTLYAESGSESNGIGQHFFTGRTANGETRRAVLKFDLTPIPAGSVITSVQLRLVVSRTRAGTVSVAAHRLLESWGEGASQSTGGEGVGGAAQPGDATWTHRFFASVPPTPWTNPGGTYSPTASASASVSTGAVTWSGGTLAADVQAWVNDPNVNHGWIFLGGEGGGTTAKRYDSVQNVTLANRPSITVTFTPPAGTGSCCRPNGVCIITTAAGCAAVSGTYRGNGTSCNPNPCPPPVGACCLPSGLCQQRTASQCSAVGGTYRGNNVSCETVDCPVILTPYVDPLPIPAIAQPTVGQPGGAAHYVIPMTEFTHRLHRDLPLTRVWGYGGSYPGPTIEARRGLPVTVEWVNDLRDAQGNLRTTHPLMVDECLHGPDMTGQVPVTVVHLHGARVGPESDGYPEDAFPPGQRSPVYTYPNDQPAAMLWYHDHALGITRLNVYQGLAGAYIIRDAGEDALNIPRGQFEIPLVIQDRSVFPDGSLRYPEMWHEHFFGDFILVNGKIWPFLTVAQGKYRFRLLNGSGSRTYTLALSDGSTFQQLGSDGGLLAQTINATAVTIAPGERADIVIDFGIYPQGAEVMLLNSAPAPFPGIPGQGVIPDVMKFTVVAQPGDTDRLPRNLASVPRIPEAQAAVHREFMLERHDNHPMHQCHDHGGAPRPVWLINELGWDDITEFPRLGDTEVWSWVNLSTTAHPMHIHLVQFQILDRQNFIMVNGVVTPTGPRTTPPAGELGWKDTVLAGPSQITRVIARFDGYTGLYPYHCHVLEHEDNEMMRQFRIVCPTDYNYDGVVDPDDLADFIACYFENPPCPRADFNRDGTPDPDDLADVIAAYFSGC